MQVEKIRTFTATAVALAAHIRVKHTGGAATVEVAGAGEQHIGVTEYAVAASGEVACKLTNFPGTVEMVAAEAFALGATLYGAAAGKVQDTSSGSAIGIALEAAGAAGDVVEVLPFHVLSTTAATVSIADAGGFTATVTVEAALQEIYQDVLSAKRIINLPIFGWQGTAGVALAAFADGASAVPGYCVTTEGYGIRWNNHAAPANIIQPVVLPADFNEAANVVLNILAAKVGATIGDAVTFTIEAFNNVVGALYDADADFGGASSAMTGDAVSKTVQHETRTLALANLTAYPAVMQLTLKPTGGTLGTDDVIVFGTWLEYTRKILTS